ARRLAQFALRDERRPPLARELELLVDRDRLRGVHAAVRRLGHVVQLAEGRVTGARVVPAVARLGRDLVAGFDDLARPLGLGLLEEGTEGGAHHTTADERYVYSLGTHDAPVYPAKASSLARTRLPASASMNVR